MSDDVPTSRSYVHGACENVTEIHDSDFDALADPISTLSHTYCAHCDEAFAVAEFSWADTGEALPDYYARHVAHVGSMGRLLGGRGTGIVMAVTGLAAGGALGIVAAQSIGWIGGVLVGLVLAAIGAGVGLLAWEMGIKTKILESALGVSDARCLT